VEEGVKVMAGVLGMGLISGYGGVFKPHSAINITVFYESFSPFLEIERVGWGNGFGIFGNVCI
jgi:hypothetical protein